MVNTPQSAERVAALASALSLGFGLTASNVVHAELGGLAAGTQAGAVNSQAAFYTNAACEALGELAG